MKVKRTIKARIICPPKIRQMLLDKEYGSLQRFINGEGDVLLYSANRQQALRFYKRIKPDKEYPPSIRKDLLKIKRLGTRIAGYRARTPVKDRRGRVWVAIKPHCPIELEMEICESKLIKQNGDFYLDMTVQKDVKISKPELDESLSAYMPGSSGSGDLPSASPVITAPKGDLSTFQCLREENLR